MPIQTVKLADGTTFVADAGYANGNLWVWFAQEVDKDSIEEIFGNPEKTKLIQYKYGIVEQEWHWMTKLVAVIVNDDGQTSVRMNKGESDDGGN